MRFDLKKKEEYIINLSVYIININVNNLEQKGRKSKDTSVDEEERNPVNNEQGNFNLGTFLFLF